MWIETSHSSSWALATELNVKLDQLAPTTTFSSSKTNIIGPFTGPAVSVYYSALVAQQQPLWSCSAFCPTKNKPSNNIHCYTDGPPIHLCNTRFFSFNDNTQWLIVQDIRVKISPNFLLKCKLSREKKPFHQSCLTKDSRVLFAELSKVNCFITRQNYSMSPSPLLGLFYYERLQVNSYT